MAPRRLVCSLYAAGCAAAIAVGACSFDWNAFDPRLGGGGSSASGGGSVGAGASGGGGSSSSAGGGGSSSSAGAGGSAPALVDRGLVTRYYLDEAASGMTPTLALDAAANPLDLPLDYGGGAGGGGPNMSYVESMGHRGLSWLAKNLPGSAAIAVAGTKLQVLDGATEGTIECVLESVDASGAGVCGRISQLGVNNNGNFTLCLTGPNQVSFRLNSVVMEAWTVPLPTLGRVVLHAVMDTSLADPDARARLYLDGVDQGVGGITNAPPLQGDTIVLTSGDYVLGNRVVGDGSIEGSIYYCALYSVPLDPSEIANNAALLAIGDDTP